MKRNELFLTIGLVVVAAIIVSALAQEKNLTAMSISAKNASTLGTQ